MTRRCTSPIKYFDTTNENNIEHHNLFDIMRKIRDYGYTLLALSDKTAIRLRNFSIQCDQVVIIVTKLVILWDKAIVLATSFAEEWVKIVIHLKCFSTPWNNFVIHPSRFSTLWDINLKQLTRGLSLSDENVTVDTKFKKQGQNGGAHHEFSDTVWQKVILGAKFLALWIKFLDQLKTFETMNNVLIPSRKY